MATATTRLRVAIAERRGRLMIAAANRTFKMNPNRFDRMVTALLTKVLGEPEPLSDEFAHDALP